MNTAASSSVRLRALEPEDLDLLYRIENDERLWAVGPTSVPYSRYALHDYVAHQTGDIYTERQVRLVIEIDGKDVAGLVDVVNFDPKHLRAEVGMVVEQPYRGRGVGRAALFCLHDYALSTLHLHQLYADIAVSNAASLALFEKAGYSPCGTFRQWLLVGDSFVSSTRMQLIL